MKASQNWNYQHAKAAVIALTECYMQTADSQIKALRDTVENALLNIEVDNPMPGAGLSSMPSASKY